MLIHRLLSGGAYWDAYAPPSLCFADAEGGGDAGGDGGGAQAGASPGEAGSTAAASQAGAPSEPIVPDKMGLAEGGETLAPADWPDDWRERLAGSDEASLGLLKRLGSPSDLFKKVLAQEQTIRRGAHKVAPELPENASEEQVAEYRKALGIPEKPEGYDVKIDPALNPSPQDKELLNGFLAHMHSQHVPPAAVKAAMDWHQHLAIKAREAQDAAQSRARAEVTMWARKEYGAAECKKNETLTKELLDRFPGLKKMWDHYPLSDVEITRDLVSLAREMGDPDVVYSGDGSGGGKSLDEQLAELRTKDIDGKLTDAEEKRYMDLLAAREQRNSKRNRAA